MMAASGPLGFWLQGRVETYLDARTPLYFDDTDFGIARELWKHEDALERWLDTWESSAAQKRIGEVVARLGSA